MAEILMTPSEHCSYSELSFTEFIDQYTQHQALYEGKMPKTRLFELTLPWLIATEQFMLPENSQVLVHCLYQKTEGQESTLSIAWPLVHITDKKSSKVQLRCLTSFYSALGEPIFFMPAVKENLLQLFSYIEQQHQWHSMQLGAFEDGIVSEALIEYFRYQKIFSQTNNIYQQDITDYVSYYQQRPSQLRNTIKRRENKLAKAHQYRIEIITHVDKFPAAFTAYQVIYQQSWKGDEFSFDFIEQVCLAALAENKLRLGLLFVDDEPAAAQLWFLQSSCDECSAQQDKMAQNNSRAQNSCIAKNDSGQRQTTASIFKLAYRPKYQQYSVGSILSLALSEFVISQDHVSRIEFGMGAEPYKKEWLNATRVRSSYQIFNAQSISGKLAILRNIVLPRLVRLFTRKNSK
ncbi:GNAT family N-acetyltransferase [Colwellia piezophila]|uniref:GNAT family N-acetyltransferase n=1 Tax=Colwellia piezophila TaxID=211668 RepID=UPI000369DAF9|nr:GNAT family N-acetyltransferase [Colwellia piezophila]